MSTWPTDEEVAQVLDFDDFPSGVALELICGQVAAREAAAYDRGRDEVRYEADMNRAGYEHAQAQIEDLRAERDQLLRDRDDWFDPYVT